MSIEQGDLKRLVHTEMHIDEFDSKLGENKDVVVVSLKVAGKEPGQDICDFVEKGYDWVLDADISPGEMDDGDYLVFIELPRDQQAAEHIIEMMEDLMKLTDQEISDYRVRYRHDTVDNSLDLDTLNRMLPQSAQDYESRYGVKELDKLRAVSGIKVNTKAPKNEYTESLRVAAGIL
jgi:hypothetical protein